MNQEVIALQRASLKTMEALSSCEQTNCSKETEALKGARKNILQHISNNSSIKSFQNLTEKLKQTKEMKRMASCSLKHCKNNFQELVTKMLASYEAECTHLKAEASCDKSKAIKASKKDMDKYIVLKR